MSPRFSRAFADFLAREDGLTAVECAVMLALLLVGCVVALTLGGTNTSAKDRPSTFTITLRDSSDRSYRVTKATKSWKPNSQKEEGAQQGYETRTVDRKNETGANDGARPNNGTNANDAPRSDPKSEKNANAEASQGKPEALAPSTAGSVSGHAPVFTRFEGNEVTNEDDQRPMSAEDARQAIISLLDAHPKSFPVSKAKIQAARIIRQGDYVEINSFRCHLRTRTFSYGTVTSGPAQPHHQVSGVFYRDQSGGWTGRITGTVRQ